MAEGNLHGAQRRPSDPADEHQTGAHPSEKSKVRGTANYWHWFLGALNSIGPECPRSDLQRTCWALPNSRLTYVQCEISLSTQETKWVRARVSPVPDHSKPEILEDYPGALGRCRPLRPPGNYRGAGTSERLLGVVVAPCAGYIGGGRRSFARRLGWWGRRL